jgi:ATP-dependent exoDNAse (exonuclease V) alpha subunit
MLVNFTNHPFIGWKENQKEAALQQYGKVVDVPFPHINPEADELDIKQEARQALEEIIALQPDAVHIMGEMNFTFQMVFFLMKEGIPCIASTTKRIVSDLPDGSQVSEFNFVKFRPYNFLFEENIKAKKQEITFSSGQDAAMNAMKKFVSPESNDSIFILKGYAGTGKTTLLKYFINYCRSEKLRVGLMASTGRAAAVLRNKTKSDASTVHSLIYKFDQVKETDDKAWENSEASFGQLYLNFTPCSILDDELKDVYIVDEASMISGFTNDSLDMTKFGTGNLLQDFLTVVGNSKIIFVGDPCQLPPVDELSYSAALDEKHLKKEFNKLIETAELTEVLRQGENSEILDMATPLREQLISGRIPEWPKLNYNKNYKDIKLIESSHELIKQYIVSLKTYGSENCIMITYKNSEAHELNKSVRSILFPAKNTIQVGDILMVVKNCMLTGLKNGDQVVVLEIGSQTYRANLQFTKVKIKDINDGAISETYLIETLLNSTEGSLNTELSKGLLIDFDKRMREKNIKRKSKDYNDNLKSDIYYNGLQAKYGYAITLQKAQGGEWQHVYLNVTKSVYVSKFNGQPQNILKWLYTAITRTQKFLYLMNGSWVNRY